MAPLPFLGGAIESSTAANNLQSNDRLDGDDEPSAPGKHPSTTEILVTQSSDAIKPEDEVWLDEEWYEGVQRAHRSRIQLGELPLNNANCWIVRCAVQFGVSHRKLVWDNELESEIVLNAEFETLLRHR